MKKNTGQLFFHQESIYEISEAYHIRFVRYGMYHISFGFYSKGHNCRKGDNSDMKKKMCKYFSMRNPYMKFQNPSMHGS